MKQYKLINRFFNRFINFFKNKRNVLLTLGVIIVIVLLYRVLYNRETFIRETFIRETFQSQETQYFGNAQIRRDGSNLLVNPPLTDIENSEFILGNDSNQFYQVSTNEPSTIIVDMGGTKRLEGLVIQGHGTFNVHCAKTTTSQDDFNNNPVYNTEGDSRNDKFVVNYIPPGENNSPNTRYWSTLKNQNGGFLFGRYLRVTPIEHTQENDFPAGLPNFSVKLEVYAVESESRNSEQLQASALSGFKLYNENGHFIEGTSWTSETNNAEPFVKVKFMEDDTSKNVFISKVVLDGNDGRGPRQYRIRYKNTQEDRIHSTPVINGCVEGQGHCHYYFTHPVLVNVLIIKPIALGDETEYSMSVSVYGNEPSSDDEARAVRAVKHITLNELNKDKDSCPSVNELLNKQNTAQQLCDALEYQENIRNNKVKLEKNRLYLGKIRDQKDQIKQLEEVVSELQVIKEARDSSEDMSKLAQYEYQKSVEAKLSDLAQKRLQHQKKMKLNVNLIAKDNLD